MSVTAAMILKLRRMTAEPTDTSYSDADMEETLESHAVPDAQGEEAFTWDNSSTPPIQEANENWIPTYDFHLAAAEIWEEKAAVVAVEHDFRADGGEFSSSQVYQNYMKNARYHRARRFARSYVVRVH